MDTTPHDLIHLFAQLGLDNSQQGIDDFLAKHRLTKGQQLEEAPFWNQAQRAFLTEEKKQDAEWCETIDVLDTLLR